MNNRLDRNTSGQFEIFYSILVAVLIPLIIIISAFLNSRFTASDNDKYQKNNAIIISNVITTAISNNINQRSLLLQQIISYQTSNPDITKVTVARPLDQAKHYVITESSDTAEIALDKQDINYDLVLSSKKSLSELIIKNNDKYWQVIRPVIQDNRILAIVTVDLSTSKADALQHSTLIKSLVVMTVMILIIVILLINDILFLEHAISPKIINNEHEQENLEQNKL